MPRGFGRSAGRVQKEEAMYHFAVTRQKRNRAAPPRCEFHPPVSRSLDINIANIKKMFQDNETLITRIVENMTDSTLRCCIVYTDGMVNNALLNESIIRPLQKARIRRTNTALLDSLAARILQPNEVEKTDSFEKIVQAVVYGDTVLFAEGCAQALLLNSKGFTLRAIAEPESEKILEGPREGFTEGLLVNLSMVRRRIRTQELKMQFRTFGSQTKTKGCICYVEGLVEPAVLEQLYRRLDRYDLDGAQDTSYLHELIQDAPYSLFSTVGRTERPDVVTGKLLEGRIAVFLDGTPVVLTVPYLFIENFQTSEDYYEDFYYASFSRILRIISFLITISLPAVYTAFVTFHQEMLPNPMMISLLTARQSVPFPTVIEAVGLIMMFQIVAETGIRMPTGIGQALSIVGALVIGQAAVEAKIVSAPMVIIVGLTGITGLTIPRLKTANIALRFALLLLSSVIGLYGYMVGMLGILIWLLSMQSFGIPYISEVTTGDLQKTKDLALRAPWWKMIKRPEGVSPNTVRSTSDGKPKV